MKLLVVFFAIWVISQKSHRDSKPKWIWKLELADFVIGVALEQYIYIYIIVYTNTTIKPRTDDQVFLDKFYLLVCTT